MAKKAELEAARYQRLKSGGTYVPPALATYPEDSKYSAIKVDNPYSGVNRNTWHIGYAEEDRQALVNASAYNLQAQLACQEYENENREMLEDAKRAPTKRAYQNEMLKALGYDPAVFPDMYRKLLDLAAKPFEEGDE